MKFYMVMVLILFDRTNCVSGKKNTTFPTSDFLNFFFLKLFLVRFCFHDSSVA